MDSNKVRQLFDCFVKKRDQDQSEKIRDILSDLSESDRRSMVNTPINMVLTQYNDYESLIKSG